jgi:hypothetical protein
MKRHRWKGIVRNGYQDEAWVSDQYVAMALHLVMLAAGLSLLRPASVILKAPPLNDTVRRPRTESRSPQQASPAAIRGYHQDYIATIYLYIRTQGFDISFAILVPMHTTQRFNFVLGISVVSDAFSAFRSVPKLRNLSKSIRKKKVR